MDGLTQILNKRRGINIERIQIKMNQIRESKVIRYKRNSQKKKDQMIIEISTIFS